MTLTEEETRLAENKKAMMDADEDYEREITCEGCFCLKDECVCGRWK